VFGSPRARGNTTGANPLGVVERTRGMKHSTILRFVVAAAALVGGYAHLSLYNDGYKDIPVAHIGAQFLLNAIAAAAIAAGLLAPLAIAALPRWTSRAVAASATLWAGIGLVAFWRARTSGGWFGYRDQPGLNPKPEAPMAVYGEIIVLVGAVALLVMLSGRVRARAHA
jgi:hypothetical protein